MRESKEFHINNSTDIFFRNHVDYCVGTGRMGLALQKEYMDQLKLVQDAIGFQHIRGHGLFCDDMAIYHEYENEAGEKVAEYNFTYLDLVMDGYRSVGLKPFLELGFMPKKLASGDQTIFYWKGNTTPPISEESWCNLIKATLLHLMERYGTEEVVTWPIEVWNEPNLPGFWKGADMDAYFRLFRCSFQAIKAVDERFRVGGPAVCGVKDEFWIRSFMEYCRAEKLKPDFVTRHHYTTEVPDHQGHYGYQELSDPEFGFANLKTSRDIIDSFEEFKGLPIHITEFSTSYMPVNPIHDTNQNAAYIAQQLSRLGDVNESYSYWTFGDIFEESGVPYTPFHGGFGLVANGCIKKPTFWTFCFFKELQGCCVHKSEDAVLVKRADGSYAGVAWNSTRNRNGRELELNFTIPFDEKEACLITKTVDEECCNPLKVWHDLGEPASLSPEQKKLLQESAEPLIATNRLKSEDGLLSLTLLLKEQGICYFELRGVVVGGDRGYDYDRVMQYK